MEKLLAGFTWSQIWGKFLDPVADKATQCTLLVCLAVRHPVLWYVLALFVVKEGFMLVMGLINLRRRKMLNGALMSGKNLHHNFVCKYDHSGALSQHFFRRTELAGVAVCFGHAFILCRLLYGLLW